MWTLLRRMASAWVGMWVCLAATGWVTDALGGGVRSHTIVPLMIGVLFVFALVVRVRFRWRVSDFCSSYVLALATSLLVISYFSGDSGPHILERFNLDWLLSCAVVIGIGWWSGCAVGSLVRWRPPHGRKM